MFLFLINLIRREQGEGSFSVNSVCHLDSEVPEISLHSAVSVFFLDKITFMLKNKLKKKTDLSSYPTFYDSNTLRELFSWLSKYLSYIRALVSENVYPVSLPLIKHTNLFCLCYFVLKMLVPQIFTWLATSDHSEGIFLIILSNVALLCHSLSNCIITFFTVLKNT